MRLELAAAAVTVWLLVGSAAPAAAQGKPTPTRPVDVTVDNFEQEVKKSTLPVYLLFTMPDCQPCSSQDPISNAVAGEFKGKIKFVRIDVKKTPGFAQQLRLTTLPTHFMLGKGSEGRVEGLRDTSALRKFIGDFLARPAAAQKP
jgi:thioredoxin